MLPLMVPSDLDGLTRQHLVDIAISQHQRLAAQEAELILQRERVAALEGEKADLAAKLARATKALFGPSSERSKRPEEPSGLFGTPPGGCRGAEQPAAREAEDQLRARSPSAQGPWPATGLPEADREGAHRPCSARAAHRAERGAAGAPGL
jgi:hypothetical protein